MSSKKALLVRVVSCLVGIELAGLLFHSSVVPAHVTALDFGMALPLFACMLVGRDIRDSRFRLLFGSGQAMLLVGVYSNYLSREIDFGNETLVYTLCFAWIVCYAFGFSIAAQFLHKRLAGSG